MRWQVLSSVLLYKGVKGSCVPPRWKYLFAESLHSFFT